MPLQPGFSEAPSSFAGWDSLAVNAAESAAMLRAVFNLFDKWQVTSDQARILLGSVSARTYYRWKLGEVASLPHDTVWRLGELLGIHKALRYMFTDVQRGYDWVRKPNTAFPNEVSALDQMLRGLPTDLALARAYLDGERAGW